MGNTPNTTSQDEGRPPLAIWPCAPRTRHRPPADHNGEVALPGRLTERLVAEYTHPGHRVADLTGTDQITAHTRTLDRSYRALSPTLQHPGATASAFEEVAWADLAVTTVSAPTPCVVPAHVQRRRVRARLEFAAMLTRPGGVVAVITPIGHAPSGVVDPAPGVVRAATCAGLVYIQHVIALTVPICEAGLGATIPVRGQDGFEVEKDTEVGGEESEVGLPTSVADAAATITSPAHLNVSVFRKKGRRVPADSRGEVDA